MEKTIEQLRAEAEATRVALAKAEEDARKALREAEENAKRQKAEAARKLRRGTNEVHASEIVKALKAAGFTRASWSWDNVAEHCDYPRITSDPDNTNYQTRVSVEFDTIYSGSTWHSHEKLVVKVGGYSGNRYPLNKDGKFNYAKIAETAASMRDGLIEKFNREVKISQQRRSSSDTAKALKVELGLHEYSSIIDTYEHEAGKVYFKFTRPMTPDQVRTVVAALRSAGMEVK